MTPYQSILVQDDGLVVSARPIGRLFELQAELDLWLMQPAFSSAGKISWSVIRAQWQCSLRYTNFFEMTAPLFRKDKLDKFIAEFNPILKGTDTDGWFVQSLGRECDRLSSKAERAAGWEWARWTYAIERRQPAEFARELKPIPARWISRLRHWPIDWHAVVRRQAWKT